MKLLSIIRHGKAETIEEAGDDLQRQLLGKGRKDLRRSARALARFQPPVDMIISSPAARAVSSAEALAKELDYPHSIVLEQEIYEAAPATLLHVLSTISEGVEHLLLVGHNPGLTGLISGLCAGSSMRLTVQMPTAAVAHIQLELFWWQQVRWGCGELQALVYPKLMRKL